MTCRVKSNFLKGIAILISKLTVLLKFILTIKGYEILSKKPDNNNCNNNIWMETDDTLLCCNGEMHEINIDKKFPIELKTRNLNCEEEISICHTTSSWLTVDESSIYQK